MRVVVTGASGALGAGVAAALAARGDDVTCFQRGPGPAGLRTVRGDLTDPVAVRRGLAGAEAVVHLAARVGVVGSEAAFHAANVTGTAHVVAAARAGGVSRLVHVSSPSVAHAGQPLVGAPAGPADPARARGAYARTKAGAELVALGGGGDGLAVVAVRPHLVWGPGDTQLVGRIVARARAGRLALVGSGAALVDTTYRDNAVDALLAALDAAPALAGRALVVSNGEPRPLGDLVAAICAAAGVDGPTRHVPAALAWAAGGLAEAVWVATRRRDDPPMTRFLAEQLGTAHWFDQRETRAALGWAPRVSLDEGFARLAAGYAAGQSSAAGGAHGTAAAPPG